MTRARNPLDWDKDLKRARIAESELERVLRADPRTSQLEVLTDSYEELDFSFVHRGLRVRLDLKEKINPTSRGLAALWPEVEPIDIFVLDETVYRRIVWHGGGGYLAVHDHPGSRWAIFGPWELTLAPRLRYRRRERKRTTFLKGKVLLDLRTAAATNEEFSVGALLEVVDRSRQQRGRVDAVPIAGQRLPVVG